MIQLKSMVVMPDHLHLRIYLTPGHTVRDIYQFVANIKRWSAHHAAKLGTPFTWQVGFHDRICLSQAIWERVDKYIHYNPLKWYLMHDSPAPLASADARLAHQKHEAPLKVHELLDHPLIPPHEIWNGVGRVDLLDNPSRVCVLQLSRRIPVSDYDYVLNFLRQLAKKGYIFASTFISPLEQQLFRLLIAPKCRLPIIHAVPDAFGLVYRPKDEEPRLFAEDRYLMLHREVVDHDERASQNAAMQASQGPTRSELWHGVNAALGSAARAQGGKFLYIRSAADCHL